jgi:hypothetical protein
MPEHTRPAVPRSSLPGVFTLTIRSRVLTCLSLGEACALRGYDGLPLTLVLNKERQPPPDEHVQLLRRMVQAERR